MSDFGPPFFGMYLGRVAETADPLKLGRIRPIVPAIAGAAKMGWASPLGTVGGGAKDRGLFAVPPFGALVAVFFDAGDVDSPYYLAGPWAAPSGAPDPPVPSQIAPALGTQGDPKHVVWETEKFKVTFAGGSTDKMRIESKSTPGSYVEIDGATGKIVLSTTDLRLADAAAVEAIILGTSFQTFFNAHIHSGVTTGAGSSGAPVTAMPASLLSAKAKVGA